VRSSEAMTSAVNICFLPLFLVNLFPAIELTDSFSVETGSELVSSSVYDSAVLWLKIPSSTLC